MPFAGYLLKIANTNVIFPHKYIQLATWKATPDQREEIRAYRDENTRNLTRKTAVGMKSKISFDTRPNLHLLEKQEIQRFFEYGESLPGGSSIERKIQLTFWNDETNSYDTGYFYRPNMEFPILKIMENDIIYDKLSFSFVEY